MRSSVLSNRHLKPSCSPCNLTYPLESLQFSEWTRYGLWSRWHHFSILKVLWFIPGHETYPNTLVKLFIIELLVDERWACAGLVCRTSSTNMASLTSLSRKLLKFSRNFRNVARSYYKLSSDSALGKFKTSVRWFVTGSIALILEHKYTLGATVYALKSRKVRIQTYTVQRSKKIIFFFKIKNFSKNFFKILLNFFDIKK